MADILGVLGEVGRGYGLQEISAELEGVLEAVRQNGGAGELVIKLNKGRGKGLGPPHELSDGSGDYSFHFEQAAEAEGGRVDVLRHAFWSPDPEQSGPGGTVY